LVKVDLKNISFNYLQVLLDEYVEYYNNRRIISINNWMSPRNYEIMLTGVN
jgi:transposase InsO family protein